MKQIFSLVVIFVLVAIAPSVAAVEQTSAIQETYFDTIKIPTHAGSISHADGGAHLNCPWDISISESYAYIVSVYSDVLEIVDLSEPCNPTHASSISNHFKPSGVTVSGKYAYITFFESNSFEIYDVSDPYNPIHIGGIENGEGGAKLDIPNDIFVEGHYAYIVTFNSLEIVDVSDPYNPVHAASISDGEGGAKLDRPSEVIVDGGYAYIISPFDSLEIVDVSDPCKPAHVSSVPNNPCGITIVGRYAYVASDARDVLEILNISNPYNPQEIGEIKLSPRDVVVEGNYAYLTCSDSGLYQSSLEIVDISDPHIPVHVATLLDGEGGAKLHNPYDVIVQGNYAYVISWASNGALEIIEISDPHNPAHIGGISHADGGAKLAGANGVAVEGNYAYVISGASNGAFEIVDISDPHSPVHTASIEDGEGNVKLYDPFDIVVVGEYAYITSYSSGGALEMIDISDPHDPVHIGSIESSEGGVNLCRPYGVAVKGTYAYIAVHEDDALKIIDISDPHNPIHAGSIENGEGGAKLYRPYGVVVEGTYAYVTSYSPDGALEIIDISDPRNPVHTGCIENGQGGAKLFYASGVAISGKYAYVASTCDCALEIIDISNPNNPVHIASTSREMGVQLIDPYCVFVSGGYAYITSADPMSSEDALEIVDISDSYNPIHAASIKNGDGGAKLSGAWDVVVAGDYAYVASNWCGTLEILDVSDFIKKGTTYTLSVPYIHQVYDTPTGFNGEAASSETAAVMVLACLGRLTPDPVVCENKWVYGGEDRSLEPPRVSMYGKYVCDDYTYGDTTFSGQFTDTTQLDRTAAGSGAWGWIESAVNSGTERSDAIVDYLELHDCDAEFIESPSSDEAFVIIQENIDDGQPVIARTYLGGTTGHYVVIVGYSRDSDGTSYFVNDPYGIEPYDLTVLVQHLDQPVEYTYEEMRLGESSRGLITVHPFLCIQPKNLEEKQTTTIQYDKKNSNTFADPLALSGNIEEIIAGAEDGDVGSNCICLHFEASGYIESPTVTIIDNNSVPVSPPASNLKVVQTNSNNVVFYWDGKSGEDSVNQANNPYNISIKATDRSGNTVTSGKIKVWVGRPVLMVHGLNSDVGDIVSGLLYKELCKEYHVETIEYNAWSGLLKYTNGLGNINNYADFLHSEIDRVKSETGAKKVDIVAHSMGGLISRWRIEEIPSGDADVGKLIMMGTPNHGALISELPKFLAGINFAVIWDPSLAINQMNPGSEFLEKLNGRNLHWYDVALNDILGFNLMEDSISDNTQYYVLASNNDLTLFSTPPKDLLEEYPELRLKTFGDSVVPYYSAKIANIKAQTVTLDCNHLDMWNSASYLQKVKDLLAIRDDELPIRSETSSQGQSVTGEYQFQQDTPIQYAEENQNYSVTILATSIEECISQGTAHYAEFTVNNDTDSLSCIAFWESGTLEIGLTDPDGVLAASDTNETMSLLTVSAPQSGVWNLSVSPVSIPASGTNFSSMLYITHPLYATVVDDTSTYSPGSSVPIAIYVGTADTPATGGTVVCTVETPDGSIDTLDLYDDGAHDDEDPNDGIYGNIFTNTVTIGVYFVNISASVPYGCETVERTVQKTLTINRYPDLAIPSGGLSVSNATPDAGDIITFSTTVENIGDAGATNASVIILDLTENTPDIIAESTFDLGAGESVTVESEWKAKPGIHNIIAQISPFAEFAESDYTNNKASTVIETNQYETSVISDNVTFTGSTTANIPIWITNQTDPGYYEVTFLYNSTIISPSDVTSDDLNLTILSDEDGELKFNGSVKEGKKWLLNVGNITVSRTGKGGTGTNTTVIVQSYDSNGGPLGLEMVDRFVFLSPLYPGANFTSDLNSGEVPLTVQFNDLSTGEDISGWYWTFGDGTFSNETNPVHIYSKNGTFDVSLTVVNNAGPNVVIKKSYIDASKNSAVPTANFTSNATVGVVPLTVRFTDTSTGYPLSWNWSFGDGGTSSEQHPTYTYALPGNYTVNLTASNDNGETTITKENCITVTTPLLEANISANVTAGTVPLSVQFLDESIGAPNKWFWEFGDGNTSALQNPAHIYTEIGTYDVTLTVNDEWSSDSSTYISYINVTPAPPTADFSAIPTQGTAPLTVQFSDTSGGAPTAWNWSFGDSNFSSEQNPLHTYNIPGNYTVDLTASNEYGEGTISKEGYITVIAPLLEANFSANVTTGTIPLAVKFSDESMGAPTVWLWTFGDNATSTDQNPTHTYTTPGTYSVNLTVQDAYSESTTTKPYLIMVTPPLAPEASFSVNVTRGTVPLTVAFTDNSTGEITEWLWEFGDGAMILTRNATHTYTSTGTYTARLTVTGPGGNATAKRIITVNAVTEITFFTANTTAGPAPLAVHFTDTSTGEPTAWSWTFGDGNTSTDQNPTHTYTAPGNYTVSLEVNGGADTCTRPAYITVTPILLGDANEDGVVNQADTLRVLKQVVGLAAKPATDTERFTKTDVHRNGAIEVGDALYIAQYNVGLRNGWFVMRE